MILRTLKRLGSRRRRDSIADSTASFGNINAIRGNIIPKKNPTTPDIKVSGVAGDSGVMMLNYVKGLDSTWQKNNFSFGRAFPIYAKKYN